MTKKIAWNALPMWAQKEIEAAGPYGLVQITRDTGSLSISGNIARYNGMEVAPKGVPISKEDTQEETITDAELPAWASAKMHTISRGSQVQMNVGGNMLQIASSVAHYNGKRVIVSSRKEGNQSQTFIARKQELEERVFAIANQIIALEGQKKAIKHECEERIAVIQAQINQFRTHPLIHFNVTDGTTRSWCLRCGIFRFVGISGKDFTPENIAAYEVNVRAGYIGSKRFVGPHDEPLKELRLAPGEIRHCADCGIVLEEGA